MLELVQEATKRIEDIRLKLTKSALEIDIAEINAQYDALRKQLLDSTADAVDVTNWLSKL